MTDQPPAPQAQQMWHRPGDGQPQHPAPTPPRLTPAGPLKDSDTIQVTRDGVTVAVPLSVVAGYFGKAPAKGTGA